MDRSNWVRTSLGISLSLLHLIHLGPFGFWEVKASGLGQFERFSTIYFTFTNFVD